MALEWHDAPAEDLVEDHAHTVHVKIMPILYTSEAASACSSPPVMTSGANQFSV
jgi:hypothetical protein